MNLPVQFTLRKILLYKIECKRSLPKLKDKYFMKTQRKLFMEICNSWDECNFLVVQHFRSEVLVLFPYIDC